MATVIDQQDDGLPLPEEHGGSRTPGARPKRRLRLKGFSWRRHWPIVAVAATVSIVWLLPIFIAHTPIIDRLVRSAARDLNGTVHVQSASLGWFSPVVLRGVEVRGPDGQPLLEIPEARGGASLLAILLSKARLGHFRLREPKLTLVLRDDGSNLEDAIAAYLKSTEPSTMDVLVEAAGGTVLVQDARSRKSWQIDQFQLTWIDPLDPGQPVQWKAAGTVAGAGEGGKIEAALTLRGQGSGAGQQGDEATLKTENVPLGMFAPLARRWAPGLRLDGRLTSSLAARWDANPQGATVVGGRLMGEGLQVRLPALGKDQPRLERLQASGQVVCKQGQFQCDRVSLESDLGNLSFAGTLDLSGSAGNRLAAMLAQTWDLSGKLDLARLAGLLPSTLRIRKATAITSGQLQLAVSSRRAKEGMLWQGRLEASNLAAVRNGQKLQWQQPILLTLAAHETRQGPVIESLKCQSDFVSAAVSGTPEELTGSALFDFRRLAEQTAGFVDLGGLKVTGDGWANFRWKRVEPGDFEAGVDLQVDRFQWNLPERQPWAESRLRASFAATGRTDLKANHRIQSAAIRLQTGADQWELRLAQPVADLERNRSWTWEVRSTGQLAQWQPRLGAWLAAHQWTLGGQYELASEVSVSQGAVAVRQARFHVDQFVLENPSWKVREPRVELSATGAWDRSARRVELQSASLKSSGLAAEANRFLAFFPPQGSPELSGTITCDAALDRLQQWVRLDLAGQAPWRVAGHLSSRLDFQHTGGPIFAQFQGLLTNLDLVHPSGQRFQEREVRLAGQGSYNHLSRSLVIDQAQLTSGMVAGSASGHVTAAGAKTEVQMSGKIDYDLERVAELVRSRYGDGIRLSGRGSSPIALRGPWSLDQMMASASLNWAWAEVYGFQVGPGEVQAALGRGVVEVQPLVLSASGGRVQLSPRVRLAPQPAMLVLGPGRVAEQVRLTPQTCAYALQYIAPVLAGVVSAEGRISIDLEGCQVPLANPAGGEIAGRLTIHSAQIGPGYLLRELGALLGRASQVQIANENSVPFRMTQGRVYHRDLTLALGDLTVRTYGSVGLDQTLSMVAELPIPAQWPTGSLAAAALKNQTIQLPISGTLRQPKIDRTALDQLNRQVLQNAARNVIESQINKQLPGLLRPPAKR